MKLVLLSIGMLALFLGAATAQQLGDKFIIRDDRNETLTPHFNVSLFASAQKIFIELQVPKSFKGRPVMILPYAFKEVARDKYEADPLEIANGTHGCWNLNSSSTENTTLCRIRVALDSKVPSDSLVFTMFQTMDSRLNLSRVSDLRLIPGVNYTTTILEKIISVKDYLKIHHRIDNTQLNILPRDRCYNSSHNGTFFADSKWSIDWTTRGAPIFSFMQTQPQEIQLLLQCPNSTYMDTKPIKIQRTLPEEFWKKNYTTTEFCIDQGITCMGEKLPNHVNCFMELVVADQKLDTIVYAEFENYLRCLPARESPNRAWLYVIIGLVVLVTIMAIIFIYKWRQSEKQKERLSRSGPLLMAEN